MKKEPNFIKYPKRAYLVYFLFMKKKQNIFWPMSRIFQHFYQIKSSAQIFINDYQNENTIIPPAPIIFPINLLSHFKLEEKYWSEATEEYSNIERINNFLKPITNFRKYKLLIAPLKINRKKHLMAVRCFDNNAKDAEINFFLSNNYLSLDTNEKNAAIYTFDNPLRYEINNNKKVKIN